MENSRDLDNIQTVDDYTDLYAKPSSKPSNKFN